MSQPNPTQQTDAQPYLTTSPRPVLRVRSHIKAGYYFSVTLAAGAGPSGVVPASSSS